MIRSALRLRAAFVAVVLSATPFAARAAEPGAAAEWFPLAGPATRVYELHRDHSYHPQDAKIDRVFHGGRMTETVVPAPERVPGGSLVRGVLRLDPVSGGGTAETLVQWTLLTLREELRVHASGETDGSGKSSEASYEPPLRLLPTTAVGESWKVGVLRSGDRQVDLRGTVLGLEDVSGKPGWRQCLKVRLAGSLTGTVPVYQGAAEIEEGSFDRVLWLARGTGIVREVTTVETKLRLPDGKRADTIEVLTRRLLEPQAPQ